MPTESGTENGICLAVENRNSNSSYPFELAEPHLFSSTSIFFVIDSAALDQPPVCIDLLRHFSCILTTPPCDIESDLPLKICKDSCHAYNILMAGSTCDVTNQNVRDLVEIPSFYTFRSVYLNFNCSDVSSYFFTENQTEFFTENCTNIFSVDFQRE